MTGQHYHFHVGKGGVGKSTTSCLSALRMARQGNNVLLVSLDPAHNQADIFDTEFSGKPRPMADNLRVAQADVDKWIKEYIQGVERQIKANYTYQAAFNLEKHLNVVKHSPGIEEYGLLLAFQHYRKEYPDADVILFDMPPTALTLKFFNLPALSLIWLEHLLKLRKEIIDKKEIITKIQFGKKEIQTDKVMGRLEQQFTFFTELKDIFQSSGHCSVNLVVNPDRLSFAEAERIDTTLQEMDMQLSRVIMNKMTEACTWDECSSLMQHYAVCQLPLSPTPLIGLPALNAYLDEYGDNLTL